MKNSKTDTQGAARIGRPRANLKTPDRPVKEEILDAARMLFSKKGYKGTSTREIAELSGLRQPSLFHYFKNKGEIFRVIVLGTVQPAIEFIEAEKKENLAPEVALFRFIRFDSYHLCTNENMIGSPGEFPELSQVEQPSFFELRQQLIDYIRELLNDGMTSGVFQPQDLSIITQLVFGLLESMLSWYRESDSFDAKLVADTIAAFVLRSILTDVNLLERIRQDAGPLRYKAEGLINE